eukprot:CAMPEP_0115755436 /NCGR_PEP_ID=MMETSP0272-20121206/97392_1 /TAXON_ID=71861 /ORGANISM="Scrippsiella trochoidea, Strain CCMP3099" /LENGTH=243 /DNA_ID=CAMNT_0003200889 /DNA_START=118 /DNA_END=850 /DNA_ORIENTATION=+
MLGKQPNSEEKPSEVEVTDIGPCDAVVQVCDDAVIALGVRKGIRFVEPAHGLVPNVGTVWRVVVAPPPPRSPGPPDLGLRLPTRDITISARAGTSGRSSVSDSDGGPRSRSKNRTSVCTSDVVVIAVAVVAASAAAADDADTAVAAAAAADAAAVATAAVSDNSTLHLRMFLRMRRTTQQCFCLALFIGALQQTRPLRLLATVPRARASSSVDVHIMWRICSKARNCQKQKHNGCIMSKRISI